MIIYILCTLLTIQFQRRWLYIYIYMNLRFKLSINVSRLPLGFIFAYYYIDILQCHLSLRVSFHSVNFSHRDFRNVGTKLCAMTVFILDEINTTNDSIETIRKVLESLFVNTTATGFDEIRLSLSSPVRR